MDLEQLPQETKDKVEKSGLVEYYEYISRNLGVFL
jgi:hypothetical protein